MKRAVLVSLFLIIIGCFLTACKVQDNTKTNGEGEGVVSGTFRGEAKEEEEYILVEVMLQENQISHIEILKHNETPGFEKAMTQLIDDIVAKNSIEVDGISGATKTSKRFLKAVENAITAAGITPKDLASSNELNRKTDGESSKVDCDILIIGGGGAGLSAAIEARSQGDDRVVLLEKMSFGGGNTRMSGGEYAAPGNWVQTSLGIEDSEELFFKDIYEGGNKKGNKELINIVVQNALPNAYWLRDFVGVEYKDYQSWYGGHTVSRTLWPVGDGPKYVDTLIDKAVELGTDIHYNTRAEEFICNEEGKVVGVRAKRSGKTIEYIAKKGVILATGGFGANVEMRMKYDTRWNGLDESIPTTNSPAIVGDGLIMAEKAGANLIGLGDIQLYPINNPATGNYYFMDYARLNSNALLINKNGKRFVDEKNTRDKLSNEMLKQPDAKAYELIDSQVVQDMNLELLYEGEIAKCYEQGVLVRGSLRECCDYFDLPLEEVQKTIQRFNSFAEKGTDEDFGRTKNLEKIGDDTYYMFSCIVSVHHTMGGVEIDKYARVLGTDGKPIKGLYAAGEVTGGIHGENRLGSLSMPDTVTFGRIAAQSAKKMK